MTVQQRESMQELLNGADKMSPQEFAAEVNMLALSMEGYAQCQRGECIPFDEAMERLQNKWS